MFWIPVRGLRRFGNLCFISFPEKVKFEGSSVVSTKEKQMSVVSSQYECLEKKSEKNVSKSI